MSFVKSAAKVTVFFGVICGAGFATSARASEIKNLRELGSHHQVLLLEKNENPQNQIVVYTRVDNKCRFIRGSGKNRSALIGFYWLLNRSRYKPLSSFVERRIYDKVKIKSSDRLRSEPDDGAEAWSDSLRLESDLLVRFSPVFKNAQIEIRSREKRGRCEVRTFAQLPNTNELMRLTSVFSELKKTWLPPFRKVLSVTLKGQISETGKPILKTIRGT